MRDLAGAIPETLAQALLRYRLRPRPRRKPVVGDQVAVDKVATDEAGDGTPHLRERSWVADVVLAGKFGNVALQTGPWLLFIGRCSLIDMLLFRTLFDGEIPGLFRATRA